MNCSDDGFSDAELELAVEVKTVKVYDGTNGDHVKDKQKRTTNQALGQTLNTEEWWRMCSCKCCANLLV